MYTFDPCGVGKACLDLGKMDILSSERLSEGRLTFSATMGGGTSLSTAWLLLYRFIKLAPNGFHFIASMTFPFFFSLMILLEMEEIPLVCKSPYGQIDDARLLWSISISTWQITMVQSRHAIHRSRRPRREKPWATMADFFSALSAFLKKKIRNVFPFSPCLHAWLGREENEVTCNQSDTHWDCMQDQMIKDRQDRCC